MGLLIHVGIKVEFMLVKVAPCVMQSYTMLIIALENFDFLFNLAPSCYLN